MPGETMDFSNSLYIACALSEASEEYVADVMEVRRSLEEDHGIKVLHFLGKSEEHSPRDIFRWDSMCASNCSAFLGIYGYGSDGRGDETGIALRRGVPTLGIAPDGIRISNYTRGIYEEYNQPLVSVSNIRDEVPRLAVERFVTVERVLSPSL